MLKEACAVFSKSWIFLLHFLERKKLLPGETMHFLNLVTQNFDMRLPRLGKFSPELVLLGDIHDIRD